MNDLKYKCWGTAKELVDLFPHLPEIELQGHGYRVKVKVHGLTKKEKKQKIYEELLHLNKS